MPVTHRNATLPVIGAVALYKRRGQKHIRISIEQEGRIRISLPHWVPYQAGIAFAASKQDWILKQLEKRQPPKTLKDSDVIGKSHILIFMGVENGTVRSRVTENSIYVYIPDHFDYRSGEVQKVARQASERALQKQAKSILPARVASLAKRYGYSYAKLNFKKLKRRWGSCDSNGNLTFNIYLLQLPWDMIDYVILHELAHTRHMHHQPDFWNELAGVLPSYKVLRKSLRSYSTTL